MTSLMKVVSIARKILLEYLREPLLLGLLFTFPVILLLFYAIAFSETDQGMARHLKIMVLNQDTGLVVDGVSVNLGAALVEVIAAAEFDDSPIFDLTSIVNRSEAEIALREQKTALLMTIPPGFSDTLLQAKAGVIPPTHLSILGYPNTDLYIFAKSILAGLVTDFTHQYLELDRSNITIDYVFIPGTGTMSDFEFGVPGLIVFGIMFLTISTAMTMVREEVNGTLNRLRLAKASSGVLILGVTSAQLVLGFLMVLVTFGSARLMGFEAKGSIFIAILVGLLLSFSAIGLGLVTACLARNDGEAANLSAIIGVMLVILSGAMYPMPGVPITTIAGQTIQIYDLLPPAHAAEALRRVLIFGDGIQAIGYELLGLITLSCLILAGGIALYQRLKLS